MTFFPSVYLFGSVDITASNSFFLLIVLTINSNGRFSEIVPPANLPYVISLKNSMIAVFLIALPPFPFFFSFAFIISKNSLNSIWPDPSSSTESNIYLTSSLDSAIPNEIKGPSNSSNPISPEPSLANDLKYCFNYYL